MLFLTDHELIELIRPAACNRRLDENGVAGTQYICSGHLKISGGKMSFAETCGEPCTYICKEAQRFQDTLDYILRIVRNINEIRSKTS